MNKKIVIIYHADCPDGFGGAWAAWKKFGNKAAYIGEKHGSPIQKDLRGKDVYFIDFSYKQPEIDKIKKIARSLTMIDHHVSAEAVVKSAPNHLYALNHSGAALAWQFFHPGKKTPKLLSYIEDVDLWKFRLKYTREVICMLELYPFSFEVWSRIARGLENAKTAKKYLAVGKTALAYKRILVDDLARKADEATLLGYKALVVNAGMFNSEIGNTLIKQGAEVGIVYSEQAGRRKISLRSGSSRVDVSKIAELYGGGGHKQAAGFSIPMNAKVPWKVVSRGS